MSTKMVLVGYPLEGDLTLRAQEIMEICIKIQRAKVIPIAPHIVSIADPGSTVETVRQTVFNFSQECLCNLSVDELWLYGNKFSRDMITFFRLAQRYSVPVVPKSDILRRIMNHRN